MEKLSKKRAHCSGGFRSTARTVRKDGHFEVVGSDSGKRDRIRRYAQMNIEELDERGAGVAVWCFLPEGTLAAGDIMLAQ